MSTPKRQGEKKKTRETRTNEINVPVKGFDRIVWGRVERIETVVVTCSTIDNIPGSGRVVESCRVNRI